MKTRRQRSVNRGTDKNGRDVLWRAWRNTSDEDLARHLYDLVADARMGPGLMLSLLCQGIFYAMAAFAARDLVSQEWQQQAQQKVIHWLHAVPFVIGGLLTVTVVWLVIGRRLTWRSWMRWMTPSEDVTLTVGLIVGGFGGMVTGGLFGYRVIPEGLVGRGGCIFEGVCCGIPLCFLGIGLGFLVAQMSGLLGALLLGLQGGLLLGSVAGDARWGLERGLLISVVWLLLGRLTWRLSIRSGGELLMSLAGALMGGRGGGLTGCLIGGLFGSSYGWMVGQFLPGMVAGMALGALAGTLVVLIAFWQGSSDADNYLWPDRRWLLWWPKEPPPERLLWAIREAIDAQNEAKWRPLIAGTFVAPQPRSPVELLENTSWQLRFDAVRQLVGLQGAVVSQIRALLSNKEKRLRGAATHIIRCIAQDTTAQLSMRVDRILCTECLVRCAPHRVRLSLVERVAFYGCRVCEQSQNWMDVQNVRAVLDSTTGPMQTFREEELEVNWMAWTDLHANQPLFDFNHVEIRNATDEEVARFLVVIANDADRIRRRNYPRLRCTVDPTCQLSENTWRSLRHRFGSAELSAREETNRERS